MNCWGVEWTERGMDRKKWWMDGKMARGVTGQMEWSLDGKMYGGMGGKGDQ